MNTATLEKLEKKLEEGYVKAYNSIANRQRIKYGNPLGEASPRGAVKVLLKEVSQERITEKEAIKLAKLLGKKEYGEWGLSSGIISCTVEKTLGFSHPACYRLSGELGMEYN